jgi:hypothetical protein
VPPKCRESSLQKVEMFAGMKLTSLQRVETVCKAKVTSGYIIYGRQTWEPYLVVDKVSRYVLSDS